MSPFLSVRRVAAMTIALLMVPSPAIAGSDGLDRSLRAITEAGMYGVYSSVRDGDRTWRGASGVADVQTGRPVRPGMVHRIGSVTKAFTAVAVLRQVDRGTIGLDTPVSTYLPGLVTDARITVRMLLNHTSHIPDYLPQVFPSTVTGSPESLEANRFRK